MRVRVGGRSSSHNTRIVGVFAHERGVAYDFQPITLEDLAARDLLTVRDVHVQNVLLIANPGLTGRSWWSRCVQLVVRKKSFAPEPWMYVSRRSAAIDGPPGKALHRYAAHHALHLDAIDQWAALQSCALWLARDNAPPRTPDC